MRFGVLTLPEHAWPVAAEKWQSADELVAHGPRPQPPYPGREPVLGGPVLEAVAP